MKNIIPTPRLFSHLVLLLAFAFAAGTGFAKEAKSLFDGKTLNGWTIQSGGHFSVRDGVIVVDRGAGWLRSNKTYSDFVLVMEFRFLEANANSGVFVRTGPDSKADEKGYPSNGYQIQCMDTVVGDHPIGSLILYGAPPFDAHSDQDAIKRAYHPLKEWNTFEITCRGEKMSVKLNGVEVTKATQIKNLSGHIGIQGELGLLEFRRVEITEMKSK